MKQFDLKKIYILKNSLKKTEEKNPVSCSHPVYNRLFE